MVEDGDDLANLAQSRLDTKRFTPATEFYAELIRIDRQAAELRLKAAKVPIDLTGYSARKRLSNLREEYVDLYEELIEARIAVETEPYEFDAVDQNFNGEAKNEFYDHRNSILRQLNSAFDEVDRTYQQISNKHAEAISRIQVSVSVGILLLSGATLLASVVY
ncbi:hypothetical protein ACOZ4N_00285 (plasmid) [Halorientalis pallida]|uniref:hypothetical protein n=1 Tax=Halorientalis pallida TaxID=2479928 RepID=UPI003C6EA6C3